MTHFRRSVTVVTASLIILCTSSLARADVLNVKCSDAQSGQALTFSYEGSETGTLKITAPYGAAELPATSKEATNTVDNQALAIRAINAAGPATLRMPDKAQLEACIVKRRLPGEPADKDIDFMSAMACQAELPAAEAPIEVNVDVEFALINGDLQELVMHRTYPGTSEVTGEALKLVTMGFGSLRCAVEK
jgi:hypothetical protein